MLQRRRTLSDLQADEPVVNLTDGAVVLQFAHCVRTLAPTRRQSIWTENVTSNDVVQSQTTLQHQIDDILLFLLIIFTKEEYPEEEQELISKLKVFITSPPFVTLKSHIKQKYFPLYQEEFIHNNEYFAAMIEDYAQKQLGARLRRTESPSSSNSNLTKSASLHQMMDAMLYKQMENRLMDLFTSKFGEISRKINNLEKEIYSIKNTLKSEHKLAPGLDKKISTDNIMKELLHIKQEMHKITKTRSKSGMVMKSKTKKKQIMKPHKKTSANPQRKTLDRSRMMERSMSLTDVQRKRKQNKKRSSRKLKKAYNVRRERETGKRRDALKTWLDGCDLGQYFEVFVENRLDNLEIMQHVKMTDLALMGVSNNSHKVNIMQNIQKLKYEQTVRNRETSAP